MDAEHSALPHWDILISTLSAEPEWGHGQEPMLALQQEITSLRARIAELEAERGALNQHIELAFAQALSARTQGAAEAYARAARLVCGYCDGHFPQWNREAERGASGSGNWVHRKKGDASHPAPVICAATGIYNKLEYDRALKGESK